MRLIDRIALLLGAATATLPAIAVAEPVVDVSLTVGRGNQPAGRPQVVTITGFPNPSGVSLGTASLWSLQNGGFLILDNPSLVPSVHPQLLQPFTSPLLAQSAYSFSDRLTFESYEEIPGFLNRLASDEETVFEGLDYQDNCYAVSATQFQFAGPSRVVQNCDSLDFSASIEGTGIRITGGENSLDLTFSISSVGYSYTSIGNGRSEEALSAFWTDFRASPAAIQVAERFLPGASSIAPGTLPRAGELFNFSGTVRRSAAPQTQFSPAQAAANHQLTFGFDNITQAMGYLIVNRNATNTQLGIPGFEYRENCFRPDPLGPVFDRCDAVDLRLDLAGVDVQIRAAENDVRINFLIPDIGVDFTPSSAFDRSDSAEQFTEFMGQDGRLDRLVSRLAQAFSERRPDDPLVGNPNSLQGMFNRALLNLDHPSDLLGETGWSRGEGDPPGWLVGGRVGYLQSSDLEANFIDGAVERGWRFGEGTRSRFKLSAPFSYTDYGEGNRQSNAAVRASAEILLLEDRWVIEPAVGVGYFFETDEIGSGALYAVGVSSRFKIAPVGRGHIVIGNAINYSSTIEIEGSGPLLTPTIENTSFRNGLAYQLPVGQRMFGRQGTLRASYSYTSIDGDRVFLDAYHDVSVSFGLGSREVTARQFYDVFRIGASATVGEDFEAYSVNVGFRF